MAGPGALVTSMLESWTTTCRDSSSLAPYFADSAVYQPAPGLAPLAGRDAILGFTGRLLAIFDSIEIETLHQSVSGDVVMNERRDVLRRRGHKIEVPAMGIFEVQNDLITTWRDYSDMNAVLGGLSFGATGSERPRQRRWARLRG